MQSLPPSVRLPDHYAEVGLILEWRQLPDRSWEALVEYEINVPGFKGGIDRDSQWFPAYRVKPIEGENYSRVPRSYAAPPEQAQGT